MWYMWYKYEMYHTNVVHCFMTIIVINNIFLDFLATEIVWNNLHPTCMGTETNVRKHCEITISIKRNKLKWNRSGVQQLLERARDSVQSQLSICVWYLAFSKSCSGQLSIGKMDKKNCSICSQTYEFCKNCEKYGWMKGCVVEDKKQGWHDNSGYVEDPVAGW